VKRFNFLVLLVAALAASACSSGDINITTAVTGPSTGDNTDTGTDESTCATESHSSGSPTSSTTDVDDTTSGASTTSTDATTTSASGTSSSTTDTTTTGDATTGDSTTGEGTATTATTGATTLSTSDTTTTSSTTNPFGDLGCGLEGGLFGPCDLGTCDAPFTCRATALGSTCIPPEWVVDGEYDDAVVACSETLGGTVDCTIFPDWCALACVEGACGDAVCDVENGNLCVWP
jgi:hypothetical protein